MKLLLKDYKKLLFKVLVESNEDLWSLYQLIEKGDIITSRTLRKIKKVEEAEGERKKVTLKISVEKVEFQQAVFVLKILGKVIEGHKDVPSGSYHSFNVKIGDTLIINKLEFSVYHKEILKKALESKKPSLLLVTVDPPEAHIGLLKPLGFEVTSSIEESFPRKEYGKEHEKAVNEFYSKVVQMVIDSLKSHKLKSVLIGGTGFSSERLKKELSEKVKDVHVESCKVSYSGINGFGEMIKKGLISKFLAEHSLVHESKLINKLLEEIKKDSGLGIYGFDNVKKALDLGAMEILLVSEKLLIKSREEGSFKELEELIKQAEKQKTSIEFISDKHELGEQFFKLGGIGGILRWRIQ